MHVIQIAPPHLETNDSPSLALRVCHEADSALVGYLAGNGEILSIADLDVPTAEGPIEREWTEEMLQAAAAPVAAAGACWSSRRSGAKFWWTSWTKSLAG
ncbi:hypothetical protein CKF53_12550 [Corynebacterium striatum]|uniref:hypothetical protein n=1 Tax=Corynebacterium striatum TaxID=43770 RepID=UPI00066967DB|nr:hypothetical protein CKF53_12550 [Corynebacterium striatum]HAT1300440.1 hypothetical protein [Corynebacterium striatum]HAT1443205.1 hypothetical protein [Corynebacterium striatum]HAT1463559.1 hypothetical protein [Corynebacterium striatum]HAT1487013.1 hypothetical protein [Corynebacterium striatum]